MTMTNAAVERIEVVCLREGEWRLCDRQVPPEDSRRLISYVEQLEDGFDVLWLPTLLVEHMSSLSDAVEVAQHYCRIHRDV